MAAHYIGTQQVLLQTGRRQDSYALQSQAAWLCSHALLETMQTLFDRFGGGDTVLQIDTLELDLGQLPADRFEQAFAARFAEVLEAVLADLLPGAQAPADGSFRTLLPEERLLERWESFLTQGYLSGWNGSADDLLETEALLDALTHSPAGRARIRELLLRQRRALVRLLHQYPAAFRQQVLELLGAALWILRWAAQAPASLPASARAALQAVLIQWALGGALTAEALAALLQTLPGPAAAWQAGGSPPAPDPGRASPDSDGWAGWLAALAEAAQESGIPEAGLMAEAVRLLPPPAPQPPPPQPEAAGAADAEEPEALFVSHAGLVLLHPFLPALFENLGLLDGDQFAGSDAHGHAVQIMGYLAAGSASLPEYELPVAKLLCGYPLQMPLAQETALSSFEQQECEDLLASVIGHWEALKSTSPDGLREGFLQRAGKLEFREGEIRLIVEEKGQDILLTRLPWGIGIVKLPWMEEILYVKWVN